MRVADFLESSRETVSNRVISTSNVSDESRLVDAVLSSAAKIKDHSRLSGSSRGRKAAVEDGELGKWMSGSNADYFRV